MARSARLREKIEDEFPEFTVPLLTRLWPAYLRPVPALTVIEYTPDSHRLTAPVVISRGEQVMNRVQDMRGGRDNDPRFGHRFRGEGLHAQLAQQRFRLARTRLGYRTGGPALDCSRFGPPPKAGDQLSLF